MHYVRFLRPPTVRSKQVSKHVDLVITITTDLGESFLSLPKPLRLSVCLFLSPSDAAPSFQATLLWTPGMRVLKVCLQVPAIDARLLSIGTLNDKLSASELGRLVQLSTEDNAAIHGLILPAWADINPASGVQTDVSFRKLRVMDGLMLNIEEEIGESIARHIWDAGVSTVSFVSLMQPASEKVVTQANGATRPMFRSLLHGNSPVNVLELGCGVGVLGIGLAAVLPRLRDNAGGEVKVLMTDLPEAEGRARSNIRRFKKTATHLDVSPQLDYENLDWEDGRLGKFGSQVRSKPWDLIVLSDCTYNVDMLPALVETLTQVGRMSEAHPLGAGSPRMTQVLLATKPRHSSEDALFGLMAEQGWSIRDRETMPMPVLGGEAQRVDFYFLARASDLG